MKKVVRLVLMVIVGLILAFVLYSFVERILIPNPCYYHLHKPSALFKLFYSLPASEGFHPFPTALTFSIIITIGIISGFVLNQILFRKRNKKGAD